jgi:hypothetical protein
MPVTVSNLLQGPAELFRADFGAVEPATAGAPFDTAWKSLGGTSDGCKFAVELTYTEKTVDQVVDIPGQTITKRVAKLSTNLAEATLENWAIALNEAVASAVTAGVFTPSNGVPGEPLYSAIALRGLAPGGKPRTIIIRRGLQTGNVESDHKKDGQTMLPVEFTSHYVSESIAPFVVIDKPAA